MMMAAQQHQQHHAMVSYWKSGRTHLVAKSWVWWAASNRRLKHKQHAVTSDNAFRESFAT